MAITYEPNPDDNTRYLADTLAKAIRDGFADLGDRIGLGTDVTGRAENVALSLKFISDAISESKEG